MSADCCVNCRSFAKHPSGYLQCPEPEYSCPLGTCPKFDRKKFGPEKPECLECAEYVFDKGEFSWKCAAYERGEECSSASRPDAWHTGTSS